jgi:hypothetical protein
MDPRPTSPYAVPLTELESVHVAADEQLTSQPELRYADPRPAVVLFPDAPGGDGDGD